MGLRNSPMDNYDYQMGKPQPPSLLNCPNTRLCVPMMKTLPFDEVEEGFCAGELGLVESVEIGFNFRRHHWVLLGSGSLVCGSIRNPCVSNRSISSSVNTQNMLSIFVTGRTKTSIGKSMSSQFSCIMVCIFWQFVMKISEPGAGSSHIKTRVVLKRPKNHLWDKSEYYLFLLGRRSIPDFIRNFYLELLLLYMVYLLRTLHVVFLRIFLLIAPSVRLLNINWKVVKIKPVL